MDEPAGKAVRDILGLVFRRQGTLWVDWRPWLALLGVVGALSLPLYRFSASLSSPLVLRLAVFFHDGIAVNGSLTVGQDSFVVVCQCLALMSWLWASGFAIGFLSP